ncbi:MAG: PD-(D/E)XK nuclease family protein [Candidatus Limimorpha sp.]
MKVDKEKILLESMIGAPVSRTACAQIPVDTNLPVEFQQSTIHYELYKHHVELHIESSNYSSLCNFLEQNLPKNDISGCCERSFCKFAYSLNREVKGWMDIEELGNAIIELRSIVEPVLLSYCNQIVENLELAKVLADYYESQKECLPFHINVIDELHANENAHSRILAKLLKYKTDGCRVILSSFLSLLEGFNESIRDINESSVYCNKDFIDCLVECPGKYAVIVENKIHNAEDQDKQIERYVNAEISKEIPKDKIWVIYLTSDGMKIVDNRSFTQETKAILGNRFVTLDYRNDILPWLRDSVLPNCKLREDWLISALKQYVDHLEGMFNLRSSQSELRLNMEKKISSSIGITKDLSPSEKYSRLRDFTRQVESIQNMLGTISSNMVKSVVNKFQNSTVDVLKELCPELDFDFYDGLSNGFYQIFFDKKIHSVHFEWIPLDNRILMCGREKGYCMVLHIEDKKLVNIANSLLNDNISAEGGEDIVFNKIDNRTYYRKEILTDRPISEMTHSEMIEFLRKMYEDIPQLVSFLNNNLIGRE